MTEAKDSQGNRLQLALELIQILTVGAAFHFLSSDYEHVQRRMFRCKSCY